MASSKDSFTFTVGKLDAGMAILLGERAHLIEFPSILLPPGATAGSIVNISVHQNHAEEKKRDLEFWKLQGDIMDEFGVHKPETPVLTLRNVTQTSATLEWPALSLATSKLRSLDIYRNNTRLAAIPSPLTNTSTKLSGLELNTDYTFQLILRTSAGTFPSNILRVRTHTMQDTSGIAVCFGTVSDEVLLENCKLALREMGARWSDKIQIDTTHFVCTTPAATPPGASAVGNLGGSPGVEYQRALQLSIPVVQPHWVLACHSEKRMVPIAAYYLGVSPSVPSAGFTQRPQSMSQANLHQHSHSPSSPPANAKLNRASMPAPARSPPAPAVQSAFVGQTRIESTPEEDEGRRSESVSARRNASEDEITETQEQKSINEAKRKSRAGTMNRDFKFPPERSNSSPVPPHPAVPQHQHSESLPPSGTVTPTQATLHSSASKSASPSSTTTGKPRLDNPKVGGDEAAGKGKTVVVTPSSIEVPPPPPVEKERSVHSLSEGEEGEEVGDTEEVDLS
ncbi:hypothetical protein BDQ17DRAFT_1417001 [Cyathus striatus]|nr:hypothetical protein BDQ17DRAFT_1417001 [Cyathus striatus]